MYLTTVRGKLTKEFPGIFIIVLELQAMKLKYFSGSFLLGEEGLYKGMHIELYTAHLYTEAYDTLQIVHCQH